MSSIPVVRVVRMAGRPVSGLGSSPPFRSASTWPVGRTLIRKSPSGSGSRLHGRSMPRARTVTLIFCSKV